MNGLGLSVFIGIAILTLLNVAMLISVSYISTNDIYGRDLMMFNCNDILQVGNYNYYNCNGTAFSNYTGTYCNEKITCENRWK